MGLVKINVVLYLVVPPPSPRNVFVEDIISNLAYEGGAAAAAPNSNSVARKVCT